MILQIIFGNNKLENLIGEWSVFMLLALYMVCACMKNGIWDRKLKPDLRTNAVVSLIPAVLMGILFTALFYFYNKNFYYSFLIGVIMFLSIAVLCFSVLTILSGIYKKRVAKMESEIDEE